MFSRQKYAMVAIDLDDTLLDDDLKISDYTRSVIINAQRSGIKVTLASGRPTGAIIPYAKQLQLDHFGGYVVSYNGAQIIECSTQRVIKQWMVSNKDLLTLEGIANQLGAYIHTYVGDLILTTENNEYTLFEGNLTSLPIKEVTTFNGEVAGDVVKVLMLQNPDRLKAIESTLRTDVATSLNMSISKPFFLEFTHPEADKGKGLAYLANWLGIDTKEIMAIGDGHNDVPMLERCGFGVCMRNGPEGVRKLSDYVTHSNNEDGVATAINRFVLGV